MNMQLQNGIGIRRGANRVLYTRITVYLSWTGLSGVRERLSKEVTCGLQPKHWKEYQSVHTQASGLQHCKKTNFCCLSQSVVLRYSSPSKLIQVLPGEGWVREVQAEGRARGAKTQIQKRALPHQRIENPINLRVCS